MTVTISSLSMVASTLGQPVEEAGVEARTLFSIRPTFAPLLRTTERAFLKVLYLMGGLNVSHVIIITIAVLLYNLRLYSGFIAFLMHLLIV
jgi:hypothetical protein